MGSRKISFLSSLFLLLFSVSLIISIGCKSNVTKTVAAVNAEQLFAFQVYPLLESKCFACHGEDPNEIEGEFNMLSLAQVKQL